MHFYCLTITPCKTFIKIKINKNWIEHMTVYLKIDSFDTRGVIQPPWNKKVLCCILDFLLCRTENKKCINLFLQRY